MSAWGTGPFDNDSAADWAGELEDTPPSDRLELLRATLRTVLPDGAGTDDEDWAAEEAVAAAAVVAAALPGGPAVDENYGPSADVVAALRVDEGLRALALRAVQEATREGSEWHDLWSEAGEVDAATTALQPVVDALRRS